MIKLRQAGDTLVEVMLSMAVISMVIGAAYAVSNRATQLGRLAQQRTQINNLMRAQAEYLSSFQNSDSTQWHTIQTVTTSLNSGGPPTPVACPVNNSNAFYVDSSGNVHTGKLTSSTNPYEISIVPYNGNGYGDYYIIGCWLGPGEYGQQQSFIIERLNNTAP